MTASSFGQKAAKRLLVLGLCLAGPAIHANSQELDTNQEISIAIGNEPPYTELKSDGTLAGAGPDIDRAALDAAGFKNFKGEIVPYGAMIPAIQANRVKMLSAGALVIRPERCAQVIFAEPAICNSQAFLVRGDDAKRFRSYQDVAAANVKMGAIAGGVQERNALEAGVKRENIVNYPDGPSGVKLLQDGRVDAIALNDSGVLSMKERSGDNTLEAVIPIENTPIDCASAAFNKSDTALRDAYNVGLKKLIDSGKFEEIMNGYGLQSGVQLLSSAKTTQELCSM